MEFNLDWQCQNSEIWPGVSYDIRPLKVWAFQEFLAYWEQRRNAADKEGGAETGFPARGDGLMEIARKVFPDHVRNLEGVRLRENGASAPATVEKLCEETLLMPLAGEIISRLIALSETTEAQEKN